MEPKLPNHKKMLILFVTTLPMMNSISQLETMHSPQNTLFGDGSNQKPLVMEMPQLSELSLIPQMKLTMEIQISMMMTGHQISQKQETMSLLLKLSMENSNSTLILSEFNKYLRMKLFNQTSQKLMPQNGHSFILLIVSLKRQLNAQFLKNTQNTQPLSKLTTLYQHISDFT